ncbi:MAG TPA: hypothetical protein VFH10_13085 [Nocardioides sp.]|uniref:hypothetical protein n=1 Tax=Nocardioides sp. TaxID=35761 RepID=UPI002D80D0FC|nr:hypothetical protein [Nocardioides sp.]HET6653572.1 hypothetical protein [Nocardioides sp.]
MEPVVDDLERRAVADALVSNHASLVAAECRELVLAAQWADLHPMSSGTVLPGTERARRYGGDGTPFAGEFAAAELGVLLGRSHVAAATLMADALDVRHRLPRLWAALTAGQVRVWQARHVASRTRATGLSLAQAREVDAATTPYLATLPWGGSWTCWRRGSSPPTRPPPRPDESRRSWTGSWSPGSPTSPA